MTGLPAHSDTLVAKWAKMVHVASIAHRNTSLKALHHV